MAREASDVLAFAERIAALCSQVLGETLVSIIVHGFLALDDYTPPYSDIDLLGIVNGPPLLDHCMGSLRSVLLVRTRGRYAADCGWQRALGGPEQGDCPGAPGRDRRGDHAAFTQSARLVQLRTARR
jgi:hypothetical protein